MCRQLQALLYLLGRPAASIAEAITYPDVDAECHLATAFPGDRVSGVGASDCDCDAHLLAVPDRGALLTAARAERDRTVE